MTTIQETLDQMRQEYWGKCITCGNPAECEVREYREEEAVVAKMCSNCAMDAVDRGDAEHIYEEDQ